LLFTLGSFWKVQKSSNVCTTFSQQTIFLFILTRNGLCCT
jgi:hypothetical protein